MTQILMPKILMSQNLFQTHLKMAEWVAVTDYAMIGRVSWLLGSSSKVWALNEPHRYLFRDSFPSRLCNVP